MKNLIFLIVLVAAVNSLTSCASLPSGHLVTYAKKTQDGGRINYPAQARGAFRLASTKKHVDQKIKAVCPKGHKEIASGIIHSERISSFKWAYIEFKCL